jgi:CDP-4-dehydro-6-deoxyglucose reductase, E3
MTHTITLMPADVQYTALATDTLLDAALTQNYPLQYSCKKGTCGTCVATVLEGVVMNEHGALIQSGSVLTCSAHAHSDVMLQANYYPELAHITSLTLPCKITDKTWVTEDIVILNLRTPPNTPFHYLPGQYIDLIHGTVRRSYSIANAQSTSSGIELHIRLLKDGEFSHIIKNSTLNQLMRIEGPKGTFFVRDSTHPIIFLAGGTGFAPVKAMVEHLLAMESSREIAIYWGMPYAKAFYTDIAQSWADAHQIHYVPVVSEHDASWTGRTGFVHQAVVDDFQTLHNHHVYACGALVMIDAAKQSFQAKGLPDTHFFSDAFVPSK